MDLKSLKTALYRRLEERRQGSWTDYWEVLLRFATATVTKCELDEKCYELLGPQACEHFSM